MSMPTRQILSFILLPCAIILVLLLAGVVQYYAFMRPKDLDRLRKDLESPSEGERYNAAIWLGGRGDVPSVPALIRRLEGDPSPRVRAQAACALGLIRDPSAAPALVAALSHPDPEVVQKAAWAVGQVGAKEARPRLAELLDHETADVRWNVAVALARLGDASGLPVLRALSEAENHDAAFTAVRALALVGEPADAAKLRALAGREHGRGWAELVESAAREIERRAEGKK